MICEHIIKQTEYYIIYKKYNSYGLRISLIDYQNIYNLNLLKFFIEKNYYVFSFFDNANIYISFEKYFNKKYINKHNRYLSVCFDSVDHINEFMIYFIDMINREYELGNFE